MPQPDIEFEHEDIFMAKVAAEEALQNYYIGAVEPLIATSALLNYWIKLRPHIKRNEYLKEKYWKELEPLNDLAVTITISDKTNPHNAYEDDPQPERSTVTYTEMAEILETLDDVYHDLGYGKVSVDEEPEPLDEEAAAIKQ